MLRGKDERGWTLIELLVVLVLTVLVGGSVYRVVVGHQRVYRRQVQRVDLQTNLRAALAILPPEWMELSSADPLGSDLVALGDTLISYKAMRTLWFVCQPPHDRGTAGSVTLGRYMTFGSRQLDATRDSLFLYAEPDASDRINDFWVHANVVSVRSSSDCLSGQAGLSVTLDGISPDGALGAVRVGAPARGVELVQLTTYRDRYHDWWIGMRQLNKASGWGRIQPILGPVAIGGFRFTYFDRSGGQTLEPTDVARIAVAVVGRSTSRVRTWTGEIQHLHDTLVTSVALRGLDD